MGLSYGNVFSLLWGELVHRPILNILLVLLVALGGNMGWAIVGLTVLIRLLLWRTSMAATNMSSGMGDMQPKMQKIQEKYADDPVKQQEEMMKLLKGSGGMFKGCLGMLIQLPVFLGLYRVIQSFANGTANIEGEMYSFLMPWFESYDRSAVSHDFLGMDLLANHNILFTVLAGVLIFSQTSLMKMVRPQQTVPQTLPNGQQAPDMSKMMGFMNYFMVIMMGGMVWTLPSGVGLYIITTTLVGVIQQAWKYRSLLQAKLSSLSGGTTSPAPEIVESM